MDRASVKPGLGTPLPIVPAATEGAPARPTPLPPPPPRFAVARRLVQGGVLALLVLAPFLDLLRFDLVAGVLVLAGHRLHPGVDLWAVYGIVLVGLLWVFGGALIHGRLWCGWLCPQTLASEMATKLEGKVLGKGRAAKRGPARALAYGGTVVAGAAFLAAAAVNYFLVPAQRLAPPQAAWVGFGVLTALIAADLLFVRHTFCLRACPYGVLLQLVQDPKTMRVGMADEDRAICMNCKACDRACFMDVSPRDRDRRTEAACLLCGLCVDACDRVFAKRGREGILHLRFPAGKPGWPTWLSRIGLSDARRLGLALVTLGVAVGAVLVMRSREGVSVTVRPRYDDSRLTAEGAVENVFDVTVSNGEETARGFDVAVDGLPGVVVRTGGRIEVPASGRVTARVALELPAGAAPPTAGAHPVRLRLVGPDGATVLEKSASFFVPGKARPR
ncbi:MAG: 4Fe-4S binding protein [Planctomycetia bacterium]|nr:4Fe-4S binding protein [Planctomycetia bacterium]